MKHILNRLRDWWSNRSSGQRGPPKPAPGRLPVLLVVEGVNDIHFLKNISTSLSRGDASLPDLLTWELEGRCLFLPTGGDITGWTMQLAALQLPRFYLFDRETGPIADARRQQLSLLKLQPRSSACLTGKRSLENYLHAAAIYDGLALDVGIDDETPVADSVAQAIHKRANPNRDWENLPPRARKRRRDRAKRLLNTIAVRHMTAERLAERDPRGELVGWLRVIVELSVRE